MLYLGIVMIAPLIGVALYRLLHSNPDAVRLVDGFVYVAVPLLLLWQIIPYTWTEQSPLPLIAVSLGILIPTLLERASRTLESQTDNLAILLGLSGLVLHAILEGIVFAPNSDVLTVPVSYTHLRAHET